MRRQAEVVEEGVSSEYQHSRMNALSHGLTACHVVLPWESGSAYQDLHDALLAEHRPAGPTEHHLVEQLVALLWRQRRQLQAETAAIRDGLREQLSFSRADQISGGALAHLRHDQPKGTSEAVQATEQDSQAEHADVDEDEAKIQRALRILRRGGRQVYGRTLAMMPAATSPVLAAKDAASRTTAAETRRGGAQPRSPSRPGRSSPPRSLPCRRPTNPVGVRSP